MDKFLAVSLQPSLAVDPNSGLPIRSEVFPPPLLAPLAACVAGGGPKQRMLAMMKLQSWHTSQFCLGVVLSVVNVILELLMRISFFTQSVLSLSYFE
jgi:hypothetical protein